MIEPTCGDCVFFQSAQLCSKHRFTKGKDDPVSNCLNFERENMPNIKITAEVNGKQVPLETISVETFEAIKALEKPKEIPVARVGTFEDLLDKGRLILKVIPSVRKQIIDLNGCILAIDTTTGSIAAWWEEKNDEDRITGYDNVQPL